MTIKELYEKAVEGGYENLPLYDRIYEGHSAYDVEVDCIQVEKDKVILI